MHQQPVRIGGSNGGFRPEEMHRRQFQRTAFETLERQAAAIGDLDKRLTALGEFLADQSLRIDEHGRLLDRLSESVVRMEVAAVQKRGFWSRLRYVLAGKL